jgi:hypothetical protein
VAAVVVLEPPQEILVDRAALVEINLPLVEELEIHHQHLHHKETLELLVLVVVLVAVVVELADLVQFPIILDQDLRLQLKQQPP